MRLANTTASLHSRRRWLGVTPIKSSLILRKALESGVSRQQHYNPGPLVTTPNCVLPSQPLLRDLKEVRPHPHLKILPIFGQWMQLCVSRSPAVYRGLPRRFTGLQQRCPSSAPQTFMCVADSAWVAWQSQGDVIIHAAAPHSVSERP